MKIFGSILILFGTFYCLGRVMNQKEMYRLFLRNEILRGISLYFQIEIIMGFGLGTGLISLGYYILYESIPIKLICGLFSILFYILSCCINYVNVTEGIKRKTELSFIQIKYPVSVSLIPISHPIILVLVYVVLGFMSFFY
jgi:hypothetical protein